MSVAVSPAETAPAPLPILIRDARDDDMPAVHAIYAHHVLNGTASFELTPPDLAEMRARRAALLEKGLPWLVAEKDGRVSGYCYAGLYRPRPAYGNTLEHSVYVHHAAARQGIGRQLMLALIERCEAGGWRQMVGVIGDSANEGSLGLHLALGFCRVGVFENVGYKFGRWLDTVLVQRTLGAGAGEPPAGR